MAITAVTLDVFESLHILLDLATQRTFNDDLGIDHGSDLRDLGFLEFVGTTLWVDADLAKNLERNLRPNAKDVTQGDANLLLLIY